MRSIDPMMSAAAQTHTPTAAKCDDASESDGDSSDLQMMAQSRFPIHVEARSVALTILATVAFVFALQWAQKFLIPLLFGVFIAYTLNPLVLWLERVKIPRTAGAAIVTITMLCGAAGIGNTLHDEFQSILEGLPASAHKLSLLLSKSLAGQPSTMQQMQAAATEIEQAASTLSPLRQHAAKTRSEPQPAQPAFRINDLVWAGSIGVIGFMGQATMVLFLVFFLLLSGNTFKRKVVKLTGPSLSRKRITVHILNDINSSIQNYMFMLLVTNILLALMTWIGLRWIGLENAGAWAVVAGLLHIMPYFGPLLITAATGLSAFIQFQSLPMAFLTAGISLGIATLVGTFVTTWMTGRIARMNPAAVFVSLLFWGWLWGVWGMLLGIPVIVIIKVVSERVQGLEFVAEILGD